LGSPKLDASKIAKLEAKIGHKFVSHKNLILALTHASATKQSGSIAHYERLEFLGDRVLGLSVSQILYNSFPKATEGELSVRLNALVSGKTCADIADEIGIHEFIQAGADMKQLASKRMRSVRADVIESLIAAIYLDGGLVAAEAFVKRFWDARLHQKGAANRDSKTALQEWAHANSHKTPIYEIKEQTGPDHDPRFVVEVVILGVESCNGSGRSKRIAEQAAAQSVLLREGAWVIQEDGTIKEQDF